MQSMGNWDYGVIVTELQSMVGARFDKFYIGTNSNENNSSHKSNLLKLRKSGAVNIIAEAGRLHIVQQMPETLETPPQFAMVVRKWLNNAILTKVEQINSDRLISFEFDAKEGKFYLVFELFAKGNTILLNKEKKIVDVLKREEYADRKLKQREPYIAPPSKKDIENLATVDFKLAGNTVSAIASVVNVPPLYVEEAVSRTNCSPNVSELSESDKTKIINELKRIRQEYSPVVYLKDSKPIAFAFTELKKYSEIEAQKFNSFSTCLEYYYNNIVEDVTVKTNSKPTKVDKNTTRLEAQHKAAAEYTQRDSETSKIANYLTTNYEFFNEVLNITSQLISRKASETEIEKHLIDLVKKQKAEIETKVEIKVKNGKIEITA